MKSLRGRGHELASSGIQLGRLQDGPHERFGEALNRCGMWPLRPTGLHVLQLNLGKMCNQTCKHCHVDAGPDRREIMTRTTMEYAIDAVRKYAIPTVDLTGGAPEMNPEFRWLVENLRQLGAHVMVRCNLTIILANRKYHDLPAFFAHHGVEVVSSLPHYTAGRTDRQRGEGVFDSSVRALHMLNEVGYGHDGSGLVLSLVYNPAGAILPGSQSDMEDDFRRELLRVHGIVFNRLFVLTNMPISRFLDYLLVSGNYDQYMEKLVGAFNPAAARGVMCRNTLSVGWDGALYDCDFNQMLDIAVDSPINHIRELIPDVLDARSIRVNQHCYGCTAGLGSSCGGQVRQS